MRVQVLLQEIQKPPKNLWFTTEVQKLPALHLKSKSYLLYNQQKSMFNNQYFIWNTYSSATKHTWSTLVIVIFKWNKKESLMACELQVKVPPWSSSKPANDTILTYCECFWSWMASLSMDTPWISPQRIEKELGVPFQHSMIIPNVTCYAHPFILWQ